ncbi:MAG: hypothetical protein AAF998_15500 [Bacteroidota bacterium]
MNSLKLSGLFFAFLITFSGVFGQKSIKDSTISLAHISIVYSASAPGGDLADRYGFANQIGGSIGYKFANNFMINSGVRFLFGNEVREPIAANVSQLIGTNEAGFTTQAIGADGRFYQLRMSQRGFVIPLTVSRIFSLSPKNPNSGVYLEAGGQFMLHKVFIDVVGQNVPFMTSELRRGYDRLTNGFGAVEGFGYRFFSRHRTINFYLGFEFSQNFTQSRRSYNYDTGPVNRSTRLDLLYGVKAGWTFPIYQAAPDDEYYY